MHAQVYMHVLTVLCSEVMTMLDLGMGCTALGLPVAGSTSHSSTGQRASLPCKLLVHLCAHACPGPGAF